MPTGRSNFPLEIVLVPPACKLNTTVIGGGLNRTNDGILHSFRAGELFESQ